MPRPRKSPARKPAEVHCYPLFLDERELDPVIGDTGVPLEPDFGSEVA